MDGVVEASMAYLRVLRILRRHAPPRIIPLSMKEDGSGICVIGEPSMSTSMIVVRSVRQAMQKKCPILRLIGYEGWAE